MAFRRILGILLLLYGISAFFIFEKEGFVCLRDTETGLIYGSDMPVALLPREAARAIEQGILCQSGEEAARYMENFCS